MDARRKTGEAFRNNMRRPSLISARQTSFAGRSHRALNVGLQITKLEKLLIETATEYSHDAELVETVRTHFVGLAARKHYSNKELTADELVEIVGTLTAIINSSPDLPSELVAHLHSTAGLVRQIAGENERAINSFMKALWILTATQRQPRAIEIGLVLHRLGIAHGRCGDLLESMTLLEKAVAIYLAHKMREDHPYLTNARDELCHLEMRLKADARRNSSFLGREGRGVIIGDSDRSIEQRL